MPGTADAAPGDRKFAPRCVCIDLEVGKCDQRIHAIGAVRGETGAGFSFGRGDLREALTHLDEFARGAAFLLGHNLIDFDLPHLLAAQPDLALLDLPAVDTLRLNPLAFPRNPYHHLVKHYQEGQLKRGRVNDPELDARLTLDVLADQRVALGAASAELLAAWHWLCTLEAKSGGVDTLFKTIRNRSRPADNEAQAIIRNLLAGNACIEQRRQLLERAEQHAWPLAYALAWLSVSGGNSVMPPWVRHQFPVTGDIIRRLRDTGCTDAQCAWCRTRHDARSELKRWFGFDDYRREPVDDAGRPLQQVIVEAAMGGEHVLGILPTGTGKSLCYQIPALSRYDKTGALTVVISPLVALMADQVAGLEARGISSCAALNGLLSMPERADVLDRLRLGDLGILIISPEQLRGRTLQRVLAQREIGAWVLDEAHCLSKWGHDFRPDYRYVGRFIREKAERGRIPPVLCLTATAKPEVIADIRHHFRTNLGIALRVLDGGSNRTNLDFEVIPTSPSAKLDHIHTLLVTYLPVDQGGGAIVYCASRRATEEVANFLSAKEVSADYFHARLAPETKKSVQQRFIAGQLRVIVATNAFGMGIDKPDVRLVVHADIPGSLENYLQEAGRAGRDQHSARCVLLYAPEDIERQFGMSAHTRLTQREIQAILRSLKRLDRKKRGEGEIIATAGEILAEEEEGAFNRDSATDDTRVRTAICWLEEAQLLTREENRVQIFPSSLRVGSLAEAEQKFARMPMANGYRRQLLAIAAALLDADADEGVSTDELMNVAGMNSEGVRKALHDLEQLGIASNDAAMTAYVHAAVERSSLRRFEQASALEIALVALLREQAPDLAKGESSTLHLRRTTQALLSAGHGGALPERVSRLLGSLARDGRGESGGLGSVRLRRIDQDCVEFGLQRDWKSLEATALLRRSAAKRLLDHLLATLPPGARGADLLAETTMGKLFAAVEQDAMLKLEIKDLPRLVERALLWLHEQEILRLNKGLAVFRPAMTIRLSPERRGFARSDFAALKLHYEEQVVQIHVMAEYAQRGLQAMADAIQLAMDYFSLEKAAFLQRWLPERDKELARQTTPASWRQIVESLGNPVQQRIVADDREQTNVLVLAGPGSGKTRVLVHRIAYLVRVRRENPRGVLALAYNRHAAVEIRRRLEALLGDDARGVTVLTCHGLAMRLTGSSFSGRDMNADGEAFIEVLREAIALLRGEGLAADEADEQRERLLAGFRWILVDEYQDIGQEQYELISALAGRSRDEEDGRIGLFAVGDDDQNIYAFAGASVEYIRRFEQDYSAKASYLIENYRSTRHIIDAANLLIDPAAQRMKAEYAIQIDHSRTDAPAGGDYERLDPVGRGRVQILEVKHNPAAQAMAAMAELERLAAATPGWNWANAAVIAREWKYLDPLRAWCELHAIPVQMADEQTPGFWRLRETQALLVWLRGRDHLLIGAREIAGWIAAQRTGPWNALLQEAIEVFALECGSAELPKLHFIEWLAEWGREIRRRQTGLLLLTAHRAKGLEFDHVVVLDGAWNRTGRNEDRDTARRLYYVAMTRARKMLCLLRMHGRHLLLDGLPDDRCILRREAPAAPAPPPELMRRYERLEPHDVDLGYAGRYAGGHAVHRAIATLQTGDPLRIERQGDKLALLDANEAVVGRLARSYTRPNNMQCIGATVSAVVCRRREDSEPQYQRYIKSDNWETVLPELVFG